MTLTEAKQAVRHMGLRLVKNEYGEIEVRVPGRPQATYFASDLDDAVGTAKAMANPISDFMY